MNIFVTSSMRTGSTWLINILKKIHTRPRLFWENGHKIPKKRFKKFIQKNDNKLLKLHITDPRKILQAIDESNGRDTNFVIAITRDIKDILVSKAFFVRYHQFDKNYEYLWKGVKSEKEYINKYVQSKFGRFTIKMWKQYFGIDDPNYLLIWFKDMCKNTKAQIIRIYEFLGLKPKKQEIEFLLKRFSFKEKTGRSPGQEQKSDHNRKGIVGDWKNYLTPKSLKFIESV